MFWCFASLFLYIYRSQTTQNGSVRGPSIDTGVYQQGAAVTYTQEGNEYSGPDGTTFKAQADARVTGLPGAGAALMDAYTAGAVSGWYRIISVKFLLYKCNLFSSHVLVCAAEVVTSGSAVMRQTLTQAQTALITTANTTPVTQV